MHSSKRSKSAVVGGVAASSAAASSTSTLGAAACAVASAPSAAPAHHFLTHLLSLSASQIAREAGFTHTRASNVNIIAEVAAKYIESIGFAASSSCNLSGRSEVNAHDILHGLSEMGVEFSEVRQWRELSDAAPFAHCMPPFPIAQPVILVEPATENAGATTTPATAATTASAATTAAAAASSASKSTLFPPRPPHIPVCLPAFPPRRTYVQTPDYTSGARSALTSSSGGVDAATRKRKVSENRKLESALVTLHQAAAKAALEQAQLQAHQEVRLQEIIMQDRPAAVVAPIVAARQIKVVAAPSPSLSAATPSPAPLAPKQPAASAVPAPAPIDSLPNVQLAAPTAAAVSTDAPPTTAAAVAPDATGVAAMDESTDDVTTTNVPPAAQVAAAIVQQPSASTDATATAQPIPNAAAPAAAAASTPTIKLEANSNAAASNEQPD